MSYDQDTFGGIPHPKLGVCICTPHPFMFNKHGRLRTVPVSVEWHRARTNLWMPTNWTFVEMQADGKEVGDARTQVAMACLKHTPRPEFIFFLDHDVIPVADALVKLLYRARCFPEFDIIAGLYTTKNPSGEPLIYRQMGEGPFWDWTVGDLLFDMVAIHMGCTLIRTELFDRIENTTDKPWFKTEAGAAVTETGGVYTTRGTEDIWFCQRAVNEAKARILVDTSVLCGHQSDDGELFGLPLDSPPVKRAKWHHVNQGDKPDGEGEPVKLALDIGCGTAVGINRDFSGYEVETTDIRKEVNPTYVMDSRMLNLPDARYDFTSSNHHLEHVPRFEQEHVWKEIFRITKPGGKTEHWVPNIEWAGRHLAEGNADRDVMNVLYGAQEKEYGHRESNIHYFGYTPALARELMEKVGFVDVEVIDYQQVPQLGYHMILKGRRPELPEAEAATDEPARLPGITWDEPEACDPVGDVLAATEAMVSEGAPLGPTPDYVADAAGPGDGNS